MPSACMRRMDSGRIVPLLTVCYGQTLDKIGSRDSPSAPSTYIGVHATCSQDGRDGYDFGAVKDEALSGGWHHSAFLRMYNWLIIKGLSSCLLTS